MRKYAKKYFKSHEFFHEESVGILAVHKRWTFIDDFHWSLSHSISPKICHYLQSALRERCVSWWLSWSVWALPQKWPTLRSQSDSLIDKTHTSQSQWLSLAVSQTYKMSPIGSFRKFIRTFRVTLTHFPPRFTDWATLTHTFLSQWEQFPELHSARFRCRVLFLLAISVLISAL